MKVFNKLLIPLLSFLVIVIAALWILSKTISPSMIKDYVANQLVSLSSRDCQIKGDITWEIFPQPGIKITNIQVGDEADNSHYSLTIDNLFLNLKMTPLLRGQLVFSFLKIDGFNLRINADSLPTAAIKKTVAQAVPVNKLPGSQFAIERFLAGNGQVSVLKNANLLKWTGLQIGAEQIHSQQVLFPFQLKTKMEYTKPDKALAHAQIQFKGTTTFSTALLADPLDALKSLRINGQLIAKQLQISQLKIDRLSAHTTFKNSVLRFSPLTLALYQGESVGTLRLDLPENNLEINLTATNLNSLGVTHDLFSKKMFRGNMDLSLHTQTNLKSVGWLDSTMASGNLSIKEGRLESVNLNKFVETSSNKIEHFLSAISNDKPSLSDENFFEQAGEFNGNTHFTLMTMKYRLEHALLTADSLYLQTGNLQIKGQGQLNLKDHTLNSRLQTMITMTQPKVAKVQQLLGGSFPIIIRGSLGKLMVLPDLTIMNPILTGFIIKEALKKPVRHLQKQLSSAFLKHND